LDAPEFANSVLLQQKESPLRAVLATLQQQQLSHCRSPAGAATSSSSSSSSPASSSVFSPSAGASVGGGSYYCRSCACSDAAKATRFVCVSLLFLEAEARRFHQHRPSAYFRHLSTSLQSTPIDEKEFRQQGPAFSAQSTPPTPARAAVPGSVEDCLGLWLHPMCLQIVASIREITSALYSIPSDGISLPLLFREADPDEQSKVRYHALINVFVVA
jgi:hypothetical protein